jgi:hypothetical protein
MDDDKLQKSPHGASVFYFAAAHAAAVFFS